MIYISIFKIKIFNYAITIATYIPLAQNFEGAEFGTFNVKIMGI